MIGTAVVLFFSTHCMPHAAADNSVLLYNSKVQTYKLGAAIETPFPKSGASDPPGRFPLQQYLVYTSKLEINSNTGTITAAYRVSIMVYTVVEL